MLATSNSILYDSRDSIQTLKNPNRVPKTSQNKSCCRTKFKYHPRGITPKCIHKEWWGPSPRLSASAHSFEETPHQGEPLATMCRSDRPGNQTKELPRRYRCFETLRQLSRAKPGHYANWPVPNLATPPTGPGQTWPLCQLARAKPGHSAN